MPLATFDDDSALILLFEENCFSLAAAQAEPRTAALVPDFLAFEDQWKVVHAQELELRRAKVAAQALVRYWDRQLDAFVDAFATSLLLLVKGDRANVRYQRYFGLQAPNVVKKPVLAAELLTLKAWLPGLQASPEQVLRDYGTTLEPLVMQAGNAEQAKAGSLAAMKDFRAGPRHALVAEFNATRSSAFGKLGQMMHGSTTDKLPRSFADDFFRHPSAREEQLAETIESVQALLDQNQEEATLLKARLAKLQADAADAAATRKKAAEDQAALDAQAQVVAEAQKKLAEMQAELNKDK